MLVPTRCKMSIMLYWAAVFFIIALISVFFGFGGSPLEATAGLAQILFFVFLVTALILLWAL